MRKRLRVCGVSAVGLPNPLKENAKNGLCAKKRISIRLPRQVSIPAPPAQIMRSSSDSSSAISHENDGRNGSFLANCITSDALFSSGEPHPADDMRSPNLSTDPTLSTSGRARGTFLSNLTSPMSNPSTTLPVQPEGQYAFFDWYSYEDSSRFGSLLRTSRLTLSGSSVSISWMPQRTMP